MAAVFIYGVVIINTSDERLEQDLNDIPHEVIEARRNVEFMQYCWKMQKQKIGGARYSVGLTIQRIKASFEKHKLDRIDYACSSTIND